MGQSESAPAAGKELAAGVGANATAAQVAKPAFSSFDVVTMGPPDPILGIGKRMKGDPSKEKVDVVVGAYRDGAGKPLVLNVVRKAEQRIVADLSRNKEYLPIAGDPLFCSATASFCFGASAKALKEQRVATVQALSGTGALRVGAEFLFNFFPGATVFISDPTWGNHFQIFGNAGLKTAKYRYWDAKSRGLDFAGMVADLSAAAPGSVVVLHVCSHNPTGVDPSAAQWQQVLDLCKAKQLLPFFDSAYQGFGSGDADKDAFAVRLFEQAGMPMLVAQSYAKNMGLYGERVGALNVVCPSTEARDKVLSRLELVIRAQYSNPPKHGAAIAALILTDPELNAEWRVELKGMTDRIKAMRAGLRKALEEQGAPGDWSFMTSQIGMFAYSGLSAEQVATMEKESHIYMTSNGRISMAGVTAEAIPRLSKAIRSVL
jgi:aspartate aminotransferase